MREFTKDDLTPGMSRELDRIQMEWLMIGPHLRGVIDKKMRKAGKVALRG